jgi:hypothetical protein
VLGAARLDTATYEEVEHDEAAIRQALGVVALYGAAAGIAELGGASLIAVIWGALAAVLGWCIWAGLTYALGTKILPEEQTRASFGQLARTIGFATAPGMLSALAVIAPLRGIVTIVVQVWMVAAMVVAVRQALDYSSTLRAVAVCLIGWIIQLALAALIFASLTAPPEVAASARGGDGAPPRRSIGHVGIIRPSAVAPPAR